ncbi:MAG: hypothetical protein JNN12_12865 [Bacteroidetes Order II. Incertae sedis bacterium]|nr:hypothetical protein [Bacteroidetes Order II. bacterium]
MKKRLSTLLLMMAFMAPGAFAQVEVGVTFDLYSQYHWRNGMLGYGPSIQPGLSLGIGKLSVSAWGNLTLDKFAFGVPEGKTHGPAKEVDLIAAYELGLGNAGSLAVGATDYLVFADDDTYQTIELNATWSGPENFPLSINGNLNVSGDDDKSNYVQVKYPITRNNLTFEIVGGGTLSKSGYYGTNKAGLTELGLNLSKEMKLGPLPATVILKLVANPYTEEFFLPMLGISISN